MQQVAKHLVPIAWALSFVVATIAFVVWGQGFAWQFSALSPYGLFPLFGLMAWSVMWSQYMIGALQQLAKSSAQLARYFNVTGFMVLATIVLHPGILIWQLWRDGFGLPPESYLQHYVAPSLRWVATLGSISLLIFLSFELRRVFGNRAWWRYMGYVTDAAMLAIFYHALRLGSQTQFGWFQKVWWLYGVLLVAALFYSYIGKLLHSKQQTTYAERSEKDSSLQNPQKIRSVKL